MNLIQMVAQGPEAEPAPMILKEAEQENDFLDLVAALDREIDRCFMIWGSKL